MKTFIYRASKKPDSYLYIVQQDDFSDVPEALLRALGKLELAMELELHNERKLARADVNKVRQALLEDGFYLQMPNESEKLALAGKKPVSNPVPRL